MDDTTPEYLYHYTNISSLALILKYKTIRFNSLKNMDDAEEMVTRNSEFLGKYCFVSSWTDYDGESIPLWGLYTKGMSGVRLKMPAYPFKKIRACIPYFDDGNEVETYYPVSVLKREDVYSYVVLPFLRKVEYTEDTDKIFPEPVKYIHQNIDGTIDLQGDFRDVGRWKRKVWEFQKEWRYNMMFFPKDKNGSVHFDLTINGNDLPFWHYDILIDENILGKCEIMTGPKMNEGDLLLLETCVKRYCPQIKITKSNLKIN